MTSLANACSVALALAACGGGPAELPGDSGDDGAVASVTEAGAGIHDAKSTSADAVGCLEKIPTSCADCATQNPDDAVFCRRYLACFANAGCNPIEPCGAMDGVCGVNTVGGGAAPYMAAVSTYRCACP